MTRFSRSPRRRPLRDISLGEMDEMSLRRNDRLLARYERELSNRWNDCPRCGRRRLLRGGDYFCSTCDMGEAA